MKYWITNDPWDNLTEEESQAAANAEAIILHGIPESLMDEIPEGTLGFFEVPDPEPIVIPDPPTPEYIAAVAIQDAITEKIENAHTIEDVKVAVIEGLAAAVAQLNN